MTSQWERLLKNQGTWIGSFTQISPQTGKPLADMPSEVILQLREPGDTMHQVIRKYPPEQPVQETVLDYRSLGRGVLFGPTGAFSQGSLQWSPVSDFGAELGLIDQTERLRIALTFPRQPVLEGLTLIREHRRGTEPQQRTHLTLDALTGTWTGTATTVFPDWQPEQTMETQLTVTSTEGTRVRQTLQFGGRSPIQTAGWVEGNSLKFDQGQQPVTVLLLPGGASASFPTSIQPGQPLFLEAGWLIAPDRRQRIIRTYDPRGTLASLTIVIEHKVIEPEQP
jgi:hypothetical protein